MKTAVETEKRRYRMASRAQRAEETAERIREVALEQFLASPYDEVTLAGVAAAAGVTVPTLIAHFGRKEELFVAVCEAGAANVIDARDEAPVGDHAGAIRNLFDSYEEHGERILKFLGEEDRFPAVREVTDVGRRYHRSWVERVFGPSLEPLRGTGREQLVVQLILPTDLFAWKLMRHDLKLSRRRAEAAMLGTVDALTGGD